MPCSQRFQVTTEPLDGKIDRNIAYLVIMLKILDKTPRLARDIGKNYLEFIENAKKSILFFCFCNNVDFLVTYAGKFIVQSLMF